MKSLLLVVAGFVLCVFAELGFIAYQKVAHPLGAITNKDFALIEISQEHGGKLFHLKKGESKLLEYGEYVISIPQLKATLGLFKNSRGNCNIRLSEGVLFVEVDENAVAFSSPGN